MRTTVQIVCVEKGKERHVKKLTLDCDSQEVLNKILALFAGHLVYAKSRGKNDGDRRQNNA